MIALQNSKGELRYVQEKVPYRLAPDEIVLGSGATFQSVIQQQKELAAMQKVANALGISLDHLITHAAEVLGVPKCAACHKRSRVLQRMGELGMRESLKLLWASFKQETELNGNRPAGE